MIKISQIDDELSIYKNNTVVLVDIGDETKQLINLMKYYEIDIVYICSTKFEKSHGVFEGIQVIPPHYLLEFMKNGNRKFTLQLGVRIYNNIDHLNSTSIKQLATNFVTYSECFQILTFNKKTNLLKDNPHMLCNYEEILKNEFNIKETDSFFNNIVKKQHLNELLYIFSMSKTGIDTLIDAFKKNNIYDYEVIDNPKKFDRKLINSIKAKVKIILEIREPVIQQISQFFKELNQLSDSVTMSKNFLKNKNLFDNGGNIQKLIDLSVNSKIYDFAEYLNLFNENVLNLFNYDFNTEKGYTIIKDKNIEVFVYQFEKKYDICECLLEWIDRNLFYELSENNENLSKWIYDLYEETQNKIILSKKKIDKLYDNDYIRHFYSNYDIEKFIEKWKPHIKGNMTTIVFICEEINIKNLSVSIVSLLENANTITEYQIYIFHQNKYSVSNYNKILSLENKYQGCKIIFAEKTSAIIHDCIQISQFISNSLTKIDKCIYLDYNVVVQKDLTDLLNIDLTKSSIGAVKETFDNSFNTSVLHIDTKKVRSNNTNITNIDLKFNLRSDHFKEEKTFNFSKKININPELTKHFTKQELKSALNQNVIFSYQNNITPLTDSECSFSFIWWKYFKLSPLNREEQNNVHNPKVSVVIPVYNVEPYIRECLDSVINQTLKEIEIICIDDGSTDNSLDIIKEYAEFDKRIRVLCQENQGAGAARNKGLDLANGDYLSFLDPDDYFELTMLEQIYINAIETDVDILSFDYIIYNESTGILNSNYNILKQEKKVISYTDILDNIFSYFHHNAWTKLYKTKFVKSNNIRFQEIYRNNDIFFTHTSVLIAKNISFVDKKLAYYRVGMKDNSQSTLHMYPLNFYEAEIEIQNKIKELGVYNKVKKSFLNTLLHLTFYCLNKTKSIEAKKIIYDKIVNDFDNHFDITSFYEKNNSTELYDNFLNMKNISFSQFILNTQHINVIEEIDAITLSIIIPVYNAQDFLVESINSVLAQTLKNIEIICVDDGSTDNSLSILNEIAKDNINMIIITQKNQYAFAARNNGLRCAKGEYVYFFDCDDLLYDKYILEKLYNVAKNNGLDVLRGRAVTFDSDSGDYIQNNYNSLKSIPTNQFNMVMSFEKDYEIILECNVAPWAGICRRSFLIDNEIYFPNLISCEDAGFFFETVLKAKRVMILDSYIIKYRANNSNSFVFARFKHFEHLFKLYNIIENLFFDSPNEIVKLGLQKRLNVILFYLIQGENHPDFIKNLLLTKDFFDNLDYSYWNGKENCTTYIKFKEYCENEKNRKRSLV